VQPPRKGDPNFGAEEAAEGDILSTKPASGGSVTATISALIASTDAGDRSAAEALLAALHGEVHALARQRLAASGPGVTPGPTTLLHEACLDMSQREEPVFPDRARFIGYAAKVMRGLIVDYVRTHYAQKRGGGFRITTLNEDSDRAVEADPQEIMQVGAALEELADGDPALADVVDLKFFCGFSFPEIAARRGVSERTVPRQWEKARISLRRRIREAPV
jgi:RNA polymerase sigma factor (TIGR02999 family)